MTHILSLGANNKQTREYVYPKIANKKDEYICPDCNKDLILCQGEIIRPYFRHKVDSVNPCNHYSNPTETQIHKDAKILLKNLLERKIQISFIRNCCCCKKNEGFEIPEISETSVIELEYRFECNGTKIADVAYIDNDDILCIFEICNTHKTCSENRPEPWFEIDAETLIKLANDSSSQIKIPCIRCEKCDDCIEKELERKRKIRDEVERKSTESESDSYCCLSKPIKEMLIDIICGDDAYKQWSGIYCDEDNPIEWHYAEKGLDMKENIKNCYGYDFGGGFTTYYNEVLIRDIQNMKLYECLNKLYVWHGTPRFELDVGLCLDTHDTEDKLKRLCEDLFASDGIEVVVTWVGDQYKCNNEPINNNVKNIPYGIDTNKFVYLMCEFSRKDLIKEYGGKWNKENKLWYITKSVYNKNKTYIDEFIGDKIIWNDCCHCNGTGNFEGDKCWGCCLFRNVV